MIEQGLHEFTTCIPTSTVCVFAYISDLFDVHYELCTVASNWKDVGLALRLHPDTLNEIEADCRDVKSCLREALAQWLKKAYNTKKFGPPSWKLLVAAVVHPAGGNNRALAEQIAGKYNGIHSLIITCVYRVHMCHHAFPPLPVNLQKASNNRLVL